MLSIDSMNELLATAKHDTAAGSSAMVDLVRAFGPLARAIASKATRSPDLREDAEAAALEELVRAVRRHRIGQPGFAGYAKLCMNSAARREVQRCGPQRVDIAWLRTGMLPGTVTVEIDGIGWGGGALEAAVATLRRDQQELLWQRHALDMELTDLATLGRCSGSAVSQRLRTAERTISKLLTAA